MPRNTAPWECSEDDEGGPSFMTLEFERICIDFVFARNAWEKPFLDFVRDYRSSLDLPDEENLIEAYLERVWPDGVPGTAIIANTRPFNHYLIRPPVEGPLAATFAAGSVAPAFSLLECERGLRAVGFSEAPHVQPRSFERTISGLFVRSWRSSRRSHGFLAPHFGVPVDPGMEDADLQALREMPQHLKAMQERLQSWQEYLGWKEKLIQRDQIALRYEEWQFRDAKLSFRVRGEVAPRIKGKELMALPTSASESPDTWSPKKKKGPNGFELGEVSQVESLRRGKDEEQQTRVVIEPNEELLDILESATDPQERRAALPTEGFLLSAIYGDLAPLKNQRRGIERLTDGRSFAPRLSEYVFDISMALLPAAEHGMPELPAEERLNPRLNQDQLRAVQGALAAPDLFLIQGPPGTGKTTVIAELCYQVAQRGGRVLVASQTNLAVDNALARLGNRPKMRPLRLGAAKRVGDEFKEFLEENVIERWFRGIRADCERRRNEGEALREQLRGAAAALSKLRHLLASCDEYEKKLRSLRQERESTLRDLMDARTIASEKAEAVIAAQARSDALVVAVEWLTGSGALPTVGSLEQTKWSQSLVKKLARRPLRPPFRNEQAPEEGNARGFVGALNLLDALQCRVAAVEPMSEAAARMQTSSRGQHTSASGDRERKLQELQAMHRRLAESEDEEELRQLRTVNQQIKGLRGQVWSDVCRDFAHALAQMWGTSPPPILEEIARSLRPHPEHAAILEELLAWLGAMRRWGEDLRPFFHDLAQDATVEAGQELTQAEEAQSAAENARVQAADLEAKHARHEDLIMDIEARLNELRSPWSAAWTALDSRLAPEPSAAPWPPSPALLQRQADRLDEWTAERTEESARHERWREIRREWLERMRQPSEADRAHLTDLYVAHSNVVGLTCNEAGKWQFYDKEGFRPFDVIIIDEVSKATPPELILPMLLGQKSVLVGDHRQLPPMFREREGSYQEAIDNGELLLEDFERYKKMVTSSLFQELFEQAPDALKASLWTQYRMHPQVMRAVNCFYAGQLHAGPDEKTLSERRAHRLTLIDRDGGRFLEPHQHILWIDSSLDEQRQPTYETQVGSSKHNEMEVRTIGRLLYLLDEALRQQGYAPKCKAPAEATPQDEGATTRTWLGRLLPGVPPETLDDILSGETVWLNTRVTLGNDTVRPGDQLRFDPRKPIGVISFYGKQIGRLKAVREQLHAHLDRKGQSSVLDIRMDTVDRFQGMERPIVIVSLVRAVKHLQGGEFVRDFRRINVALSRAQGLLLIVGARQTFEQALVELPAADAQAATSKEAVYRKICEHAARCGGRRDARILPAAPWETREKVSR